MIKEEEPAIKPKESVTAEKKKQPVVLVDDVETNIMAAKMLKGKVAGQYTPLDLVSRMMKDKVKDSIFREEVATHQNLVRQKLDYEILKDNHRNKVTKTILNEFANDENRKLENRDFKFARFQAMIDKRKQLGWEKSELKKLETKRLEEIGKTRSKFKQQKINEKYDLLK